MDFGRAEEVTKSTLGPFQKLRTFQIDGRAYKFQLKKCEATASGIDSIH